METHEAFGFLSVENNRRRVKSKRKLWGEWNERSLTVSMATQSTRTHCMSGSACLFGLAGCVSWVNEYWAQLQPLNKKLSITLSLSSRTGLYSWSKIQAGLLSASKPFQSGKTEHRDTHSIEFILKGGKDGWSYLWVKLADGKRAPDIPFPLCAPSPACCVTDPTHKQSNPFSSWFFVSTPIQLCDGALTNCYKASARLNSSYVVWTCCEKKKKSAPVKRQ